MNDFDDLLQLIVDAAKEKFGEPEYVYYRVEHIWSVRSKSHYSFIGGAKECTLEEYLENVGSGERDGHLAFMGKLKRSYMSYRRELRSEFCWPQRLIHEIERIAAEELAVKEGGEKP